MKGSKRLAQAELRKMVTKLEGRNGRPRKSTVGELLEAWLEHIKGERTPRTWDTYRQTIEHDLIPAFGKIRLDRLTAEHIDRQYRVWLDAGLAATTVKRRHAILSGALHFAVDWEWIKSAPTERAHPPKIPRPEHHLITLAELHSMIVASEGDPVLSTAIKLGAVTGCRRGELVALRWSDIDLDGAVIHLNRSLTVVQGVRHEGDTKTHQRREIALDPVTIEMLHARADFQGALARAAVVDPAPVTWVLSRRADAGAPISPNGLTQSFRALARGLGMPYHFHDLRHFAASHAIAEGVDVRTVADRLGQDPTITLRVYAQPVKAKGRELAAVLGRALPPGLPVEDCEPDAPPVTVPSGPAYRLGLGRRDPGTAECSGTSTERPPGPVIHG